MTENIHYYVRSQYGQECLQFVRSLERTSVKVADYRNHIRFNEHVTPCSVKLKCSISGYRVKKILENAEVIERKGPTGEL